LGASAGKLAGGSGFSTGAGLGGVAFRFGFAIAGSARTNAINNVRFITAPLAGTR
jgi:hypothetical protein